MTMFDTPRGYDEQPMLVVGVGPATEDLLVQEGLEVQAPDLHVLDVAQKAGDLALSSTRRSE